MKTIPQSLRHRFTVCIADGVVLMEARNIRCGDVWDCYPVDSRDEYGCHMVFTEDEVVRRSALHKRYAS